MARVRRTPRFPLGTRVSKHFEGFTDPFVGMVDQFLTDSGFYHITYDDGDSEEMTEEDLELHYLDDAGANDSSNGRRHKSTPSAKTTKTTTLVLSGSSKTSSTSTGTTNDDENMADIEYEDGDDHDSSAVVAHLVQQKVCKADVQADGSEVIVHGTVLAYFPATKTYRVMYTNGTTDDLTYREVVDSMPVTAAQGGHSTTKKRKLLDDSASYAALKKLRVADNGKRASPPPADENVNSENGDASPKNGLVDEKDFVWNRSRAYDLLRQALVNLSSTSTLTTTQKMPKTIEVLKRGAMKPKKALELFVEHGGLKTLEELLTQWSKIKENEAGVMAILKILTVIPGVTSAAVRESQIGLTLSVIRKAKGLTDVNPTVQELAAWTIKKWKGELVGEAGKTKTEKKALKDSDAKGSTPKSSGDRIKSSNGNNSEGDSASKATPEASVSHKRSKSVSHLRDLISGTRPVRPTMNPFSYTLSGVRPGSRPLGAAHARVPRRSTVLLDSIANRVSKNSEAEKSAPSTPSSRAAEVWTASRVKFGGSTILEFEKDDEVTRLLASSSAQQPSPKASTPTSAKLPLATQQPTKSILRVKLGATEREAIAAEAKAMEVLVQEGDRHEQAMMAIHRSSGESLESTVIETHAVEINDEHTQEDGSASSVTEAAAVADKNTEGENGDAISTLDTGSEEEGEVVVPMPPLSPPRKRAISDDGEDLTDLLPSPRDVVLDRTPPPPPESPPPPEEPVNDVACLHA